jgi:hypothetical protein
MDPFGGRAHTDCVSTTPRPPTLAALQRRLEERDAEIVVLKLLVEKLEQQLLKSRRSRFGQSSEQLDGLPTLTPALPAPGTTERPPAANRPAIDRSLPAHLPREPHVHRPVVTDAACDAMGQPSGCTCCGGRLRQIGQDVSEQLEYIPVRFKMALLQGGVAGEGRPAPDGTYAGVTERRTKWGLAAASMRLSTTAPMATSVR